MHCWHYGSAEGAICLYLFHDPIYSQEEQVLKGSMDNRMYIKERVCLDPPYIYIYMPYMSKKRSIHSYREPIGAREAFTYARRSFEDTTKREESIGSLSGAEKTKQIGRHHQARGAY